MKKILSLILLFSIVVGLCACDAEQPPETTVTTAPTTTPTTTVPEEESTILPSVKAVLDQVDTFSVGFCRLIMNPEDAIPLDGYGNNDRRFCTEITDDICTTAVAIADADASVTILINADLINAVESIAATLKTAISTQTGVPEEMIVISGTHSHSAPALQSTQPAIVSYTPLVVERMVTSAINAVLDLKPATMYTGSIETENMNFTRHYYMDDGSIVGDQFGDATGKTYVSHTFDCDPTLHVAQFVREGANNVVIANWRAHPHFVGDYSKYDLSSDYIGPFRTAFEDQTGDSILFLQGAAGNVNERSRITGETRTKDHRTYGALLAGYVIDCLATNMTEAASGTVKATQTDFYGDINKSQSHLIAGATQVKSVWNLTADRAKAMEIAEPYGIRSPYHANAIVANMSRTKEKDGKMEFTAITVGDGLAFVTFPGEAFDTISRNVEEGSPFDMTMFIGYANGHIGYLPNALAWEYTSYETDITRFVPGTDALVEQTYLKLLNELK